MKPVAGLPNFDYQYNKTNGILDLYFGKYEGITFPNKEKSSILGYEGIKDGSGIHLGYRKLDSSQTLLMTDDESKAFVANYPDYMLSEKQLIFFYKEFVEYQNVGDTKAPLIRVIDSKQRLKNGSFCEIEPTHRIVFSNLEYKKLSSKNYQSVSVQLRTVTGELFLFTGT